MLILFMETLDNYVYFFEHGCPEISLLQINTLLTICREHLRALQPAAPADVEAAQELREYFSQILQYLRTKGTDARFTDLDKSLLVV